MSSPQTLRYLSMIPGSRFEPLLGGGHAPHSDAPEAILRLVRESSEASRSVENLSVPAGSVKV
jgi:pimeloyl-ACP methyl ester carboxylesterase